MRSRGLLPHELAQIHREDKSQRINRLRKGVKVDTGDALLSRDSSAAGLAGDYADLAGRCSPRSPAGRMRSGWRSPYDTAGAPESGWAVRRQHAGGSGQQHCRSAGSEAGDRAGRTGHRERADPAQPGRRSSHGRRCPAGSCRFAREATRPTHRPMAWIDPIRALELYFGLLQAALDVNRQFVMGVAGVLVSGGSRLRSGLGSIRTRH